MKNDFFLNKKTSFLLFKTIILNFHAIILLSLKSRINFIYLFIKIFYYFVFYTIKVQNIIKAKYLISAGDNYYDALMYEIYKKNNIEKIYLIQTAMRGEDYLSSFYITCDAYFSFDKQIKNGYMGLQAFDYVTNISSLRLYNSISEIHIERPVFDIVFIETPFYQSNIVDEKDSLFLHAKSYFDSLILLTKFSQEYPTLKIIYKTKRADYDDLHSLFLTKRNNILADSNIIIDETIHENSYEAILDSKVVVYVVTTMGLEAVTMGKKVLCCNFENFNFLLSQNDEIGVIIENSYIIFKAKLLRLLCSDDLEVDQYFEDKREIFGSVLHNPNTIILEHINIGE